MTIQHNVLQGRQLRKAQENAAVDLLKLDVPAFKALLFAADKISDCAAKSSDRFEKFIDDYPFYPTNRQAVSLVALGVVMRFLEGVSVDNDVLRKVGINLADWGDGGPVAMRRYYRPSSSQPVKGDFSDEDYSEANRFYVGMQLDLNRDILPSLGAIEKFSRLASDAARADYALFTQSAGLQLSRRGYGVSLKCIGATLLRVIFNYPGMSGLLKTEKVDYGYWARCGEDPLPPKSDKERREELPVYIRLQELERVVYGK